MSYFYTIYNNVADNNFWNVQKQTLFDWHYYDPVDQIEANRTWSIASYQDGLPNHFVLDPTLFWRARSEERRVGEECRARRSPYHYKKKVLEYYYKLLL